MKQSRDAWSYYWSQGNATSLPELFPQNYGGSILAFWETVFADIQPGQRLLDICTGNGAIALLAFEYAVRNKTPCRIDGIDAADIIPITPPSPPGCPVTLNFLPRIQAEHLPFASGSINLAVGQFALEYCNTEAVLPELLRVLGKNGHLAFIIHHSESITVKSAAEFVTIGESLLRAPSIFLRLRKYFSSSARMHSGKERSPSQLQSSLLDLEMLEKRYPDNRALSALGRRLRDLAERSSDTAYAMAQETANLKDRLEFHTRRARDLLGAAHDARQIKAVAELMGHLGLKDVTIQPVEIEGNLLAWGIRARN